MMNTLIIDEIFGKPIRKSERKIVDVTHIYIRTLRSSQYQEKRLISIKEIQRSYVIFKRNDLKEKLYKLYEK